MSVAEERPDAPLQAPLSPRPAGREPGHPRGSAPARALAAVLLAAAVAAFVILLFTGGSSYTLHLRFLDAGRVVEGGEVQVAGVKVGGITGVGLTQNGLADISISINNAADIPLHRGTRAAIREVGVATIANNYIAITPGPTSQPALPSGATLPTTQTSGIVDLDAILNTFTPSDRSNIRSLIANSARVFAGSGSRFFNGMLLKLDPALSQVNGLSSQLSSDQADLGRLISTAAAAATAIASRGGDLRSAVGNTATTLAAIARQQHQLADIFTRAPAVLDQGRTTLANVSTALVALRPTLRDVRPAAGPLGRFLSLVVPTVREATPVVASLRRQLPGLRKSLTDFPVLAPLAVQGLDATATALASANHILRGARLYGADFLLGIFNGLVGITAGNYDKAGHYIHVSFIQDPAELAGGTLGTLLPNLNSLSTLLPTLFNYQTKQLYRCPGGQNPPSPDGSSPWIPDPSLCKPSENMPISVNRP